MIYIASPYSGTHDEKVDRFVQVQAFCHHLFYNRGLFVYSPIVHWHPIAVKWDEYGNFEKYEQFDYHMLDLATDMYILCLDGWQESKGVNLEISFCHSQRKNVLAYDKASFDFSASITHARKAW
tara:strand:+ start:271 stop:642 length:372 start_codon:yes stop_codon:yes gene_type:complete